jgi:hypothetical protein
VFWPANRESAGEFRAGGLTARQAAGGAVRPHGAETRKGVEVHDEYVGYGLAMNLVSCLTGYYISAEKGRGGLEGLLFGLVWGPCGLFLAVLMPEPLKRAKPIWPFPRVVAGVILALFILAAIGLLIGDRRPAPNPIAPAPVPTAAKLEPEPAKNAGEPTRQTQDPMLYWVIGALGLASIGAIIVYAIAGKPIQSGK